MSHKWVLVHCGQAQSVLLSGAHRYASVLAERTKDMMYKLNTNDSFLAHPVLISVPSPVSDNCYFTTHFHQFCSQFKCFSAFFHHANLLYSQHAENWETFFGNLDLDFGILMTSRFCLLKHFDMITVMIIFPNQIKMVWTQSMQDAIPPQ
jgi:hypothetical protein